MLGKRNKKIEKKNLNKKQKLEDGRPKKLKQQKRVEEPQQSDEEINSEEESELENQEQSEDSDDANETVDQKRLRLAKQLINETKQELSKKKLQKDEFFNEPFQHDEDFEGVQRMTENDLVTKQLQQKLMKKKHMIFSNLSQNYLQIYEKKGIKEIILKGHTKLISCIEIDYLSKYLYSASKDGSLIKWDLETLQKTIISYGKKKDPTGHYDEILTMSINFDGKYLVTAGKDRMIKLWDARDNKLIDTFKGHRDTITGLKFQTDSNQFCSISNDRTFKLWDAAERAYIDTFYGHKNYINSIDTIGPEDFVTSGFDRNTIYWKIKDESQLIFSSHQYSIDCVKSINTNHFCTGSQDGSIALWNFKKKKPIQIIENAHNENWITAIGTLYNSDIMISGSSNNNLNFYKIDNTETKNIISKVFSLPVNGIVNDIKISPNAQIIAVATGDEHRLGRWITSKAKNEIKLFKFS